MTSTSVTAPGRRRFSEDELLDAALAVFDARGYQAAQMSEIAKLAATTKPTLYARVGGKEQAYIRVLEREADLLTTALAGAYDRAASLPLHDLVKVAVRAFFDFARQRRAGFDLLFRSEPGGPGTGIGKLAGDKVIGHLSKLIAGVLLRSGREPGASVVLLAAATAAVSANVCQFALDNDYDLAAAEILVTAFTEAAVRGIDVQALDAVDRSQHRRGPAPKAGTC